MNTETLILTHLMLHSGQKPSQIADAVGRSVSTVKSSLQALTTTGDVWYDAEARYYAAEEMGQCDEAYATLSDKALSLQDKTSGTARRASGLKLMTLPSAPAYARKRSSAVRSASSAGTAWHRSHCLIR